MKSAAVLIGSFVYGAVLVAELDFAGMALVVTAVGGAVVMVLRAVADIKKDVATAILAAKAAEAASKKAEDEAKAAKEKAEHAEKKLVEMDKKVDVVKIQSDGMTTRLADVTRLAALAEGKLLGMEKQKAESKDDAAQAKELKLEEHVAAKQDAKELRQESKDLAAKVEEVKVTGEDTNKVVKGKPDTDTVEVKRDSHGDYKSPGT